MEIQQKSVDELINYEFNNKTHPDRQIDLLANSIKEFWWTSPICIDDTNTIIAGHGRLLAAKKLWLDTVPTVQVENLSESQIKKLRLLDNKIAELADDNFENIRIELDELQDEELNSVYAIDIDTEDDFSLPDGDKGEIETSTFTLHRDQNETVKQAIDESKRMGDFGDTGNENSNGNALARICELWLWQQKT